MVETKFCGTCSLALEQCSQQGTRRPYEVELCFFLFIILRAEKQENSGVEVLGALLLALIYLILGATVTQTVVFGTDHLTQQRCTAPPRPRTPQRVEMSRDSCPECFRSCNCVL